MGEKAEILSYARPADETSVGWKPKRLPKALRLLAQPWNRFTRGIAVITLLICLYSSMHPGGIPNLMFISGWIWGSIAIAWVLGQASASMLKHHYGEDSRGPLTRRQSRWMASMMFISILCLIFDPLAIVGFWIAKGDLETIVHARLQQPFNDHARPIQWNAGVYPVSRIKRCPHGVLVVVYRDNSFIQRKWRSPFYRYGGFFYRESPGQCSKYNLGMHLGGNWYLISGRSND